MHKLRPPAARRGIGVVLVRVTTFCAALAAITGIVVADVTAAEAEEPAALNVADDDAVPAPTIDAEKFAAVDVVLPDAVEPPPPPPPATPKKKKRSGKLRFGRFEGY